MTHWEGGVPQPSSRQGDTPASSQMGGTPFFPTGGGSTPSFLVSWYPTEQMGVPHLVNGYPPLGTGGLDVGVPPIGTLWVYPMGMDRVPPLHTPPNQDWMGITPSWNWMGVPPSPSGLDGVPPTPPQSGERAAERVLATQPVVCLLCSRRRTFLLHFPIFVLFCEICQKSICNCIFCGYKILGQ